MLKDRGKGNEGSGVIAGKAAVELKFRARKSYLLVGIDGNQDEVYSHPRQRKFYQSRPLKGFHCLITRTYWGMEEEASSCQRPFRSRNTERFNQDGDLPEKKQKASDRQQNQTETLQRAQAEEMQ